MSNRRDFVSVTTVSIVDIYTLDRDENCSDQSEIIPLLDRAEYVQTGMISARDECKLKQI